MFFSSFCVVCSHFCAFLSSFSLLSQVFSLSSTLLTPPPQWCFTLMRLFFSVTFCPHQKCLLRKHSNAPPRMHQPCLSLHTSFFFSSLPLPLNCHMLFKIPFFLTFFWGVTCKVELFKARWTRRLTRERPRVFPAELSEPEKPFASGSGTGRPGGCSAALTLWFLRCRRFGAPRCNGALNQEDSLWSQALQDLQTCGQSEILRELEVGHSTLPPSPHLLALS